MCITGLALIVLLNYNNIICLHHDDNTNELDQYVQLQM